MKKLDGLTPDMVAARMDELKAIFPEVFKDGKIDFDALQNALGEYIEDAREKYSFTWAGKLESIRLAQKRSTGTLRPCREESVDFDTTQNLYIEGDNLEVLKLLSGSYMNSIKMIYIDPPYNTGNDFVYKDDFADSIENYKAIIGEAAKSNPETAGRYHTNWLNMMLPRLKLARVLLKPDGVIFISIDDNEQSNLKKLCDEVFGENNFVAHFVWQKKYGPANDAKGVSATHEHILAYAKQSEEWNPALFARDEEQMKAFKNPDNDPRGLWRASDLSARTYSASCDYTIIGPTGIEFNPPKSRSWIISQKRYKELLADNRITFGVSGDGRPMQKKFLSEVKEGITPETWLDREKGGDNKIARYELKDLFPENVFDTPKPVKLIKTLATVANLGNDDIVLDFFSGSATTAHAVMQVNAEDGGKRKFICVQLPEQVNESSEACRAGYKNICEIGKERIRRAGKRIKDESPLTSASIDAGFKVFKLDSSNLKKWDNSYTRSGDDIAMRIRGYYDYLLDGRTPLDLTYEIILKYSLPLTLPVTEVTAAGAAAHIVTHEGDDKTGFYKVLVCMQPNLSIEHMEALSLLGAGTLFFADRCFTDTNAMTNCDEILKKAGQEMRLF